MIVFAGIVPHPPLLLPEIGRGDEEKIAKTKEAFSNLALALAENEPDTIIFISPHMVHYPHLFNICGMTELVGNFDNYGFTDYFWTGENDLELANEIADKAEDEGLPAILYNNGEDQYQIDHSIMVPLHFLKKELDYNYKILPIGYSVGSRAEHFSFGQLIAQVCQKKTSTRVAIIASGDLSHRLQHGTRETIEAGKQFDEEIKNLIAKGDEYSIINIKEEILEKAGECGYRSILILLGVLSGKDYKPEVLSYEGPFGVGYMVANMNLK